MMMSVTIFKLVRDSGRHDLGAIYITNEGLTGDFGSCLNSREHSPVVIWKKYG